MRTHFAVVSQNGSLIISCISLFDPPGNKTRVAQFHARKQIDKLKSFFIVSVENQSEKAL